MGGSVGRLLKASNCVYRCILARLATVVKMIRFCSTDLPISPFVACVGGVFFMSPDGCHIEAQGQLFKVSVSGLPPVGGGKRGKVAGFSADSRKRLLEKLARLRGDRRHMPIFVTLTYPDMVSCDVARKNLRAWLKRCKRRFPGFGAVWRLELQQRGVPHFHLLVYGVKFLPAEWIRETWRAVIGYEGPHTLQVNVKRPKGWRAVLSYVSKYLGKPQSSHEMAQAVGEGAEGPFLDYGTYLSALLGRVWGVVWADSLPWADLREIAFDFGPWFWRLKRCGRRVWAKAGRGEGGFTLFRDSPGRWLDLAAWFCSA